VREILIDLRTPAQAQITHQHSHTSTPTYHVFRLSASTRTHPTTRATAARCWLAAGSAQSKGGGGDTMHVNKTQQDDTSQQKETPTTYSSASRVHVAARCHAQCVRIRLQHLANAAPVRCQQRVTINMQHINNRVSRQQPATYPGTLRTGSVCTNFFTAAARGGNAYTPRGCDDVIAPSYRTVRISYLVH
jgi:hypothetical protein